MRHPQTSLTVHFSAFRTPGRWWSVLALLAGCAGESSDVGGFTPIDASFAFPDSAVGDASSDAGLPEATLPEASPFDSGTTYDGGTDSGALDSGNASDASSDAGSEGGSPSDASTDGSEPDASDAALDAGDADAGDAEVDGGGLDAGDAEVEADAGDAEVDGGGLDAGDDGSVADAAEPDAGVCTDFCGAAGCESAGSACIEDVVLASFAGNAPVCVESVVGVGYAICAEDTCADGRSGCPLQVSFVETSSDATAPTADEAGSFVVAGYVSAVMGSTHIVAENPLNGTPLECEVSVEPLAANAVPVEITGTLPSGDGPWEPSVGSVSADTSAAVLTADSPLCNALLAGGAFDVDLDALVEDSLEILLTAALAVECDACDAACAGSLTCLPPAP